MNDATKTAPTIAERLEADKKCWRNDQDNARLAALLPQIAEAERLVGGGFGWCIGEIRKVAAILGMKDPYS
jgi:hypothetical protein